MISFALHFGCAYSFFAFAKDELALSKKDSDTRSISINLNQISTKNIANDMQAMQEINTQQSQLSEMKQDIEYKEEAMREPDPIVEDKKEEIIEKIIEKPAPKKVKKIPKKQKKEKKQKDIPVIKKTEEIKDEPATEEKSLPSQPANTQISQNEAVSDGGSKSLSNDENSNSDGARQTILGQIYAAILKHKTYPKRAINTGLEGRVYVEFLLKDRCEFEILRISKSSGHQYLDRHSLHIVKRSCKDFPDSAVGMDIIVPILFNLHHLE